MNPDGTDQMAYYGSNSLLAQLDLLRPADSRTIRRKFVGIVSGHHGVPRMGELIIFDPAQGRHEADGVVQRIPGYGQKVEPVIRDQLVNGSWPQFLHPYPLSEKYFLASCQAARPNRRGASTWSTCSTTSLPICVEAGRTPCSSRSRCARPRGRRSIPDRVDPARKDADRLPDRHLRGPRPEGRAARHGQAAAAVRLPLRLSRAGRPHHIGIDGPWDVHADPRHRAGRAGRLGRVPRAGQHADRRAAAGRRGQGRCS